MDDVQTVRSAVRPARRGLRGAEIIHYPDSDGKPMAENDPQYWCITDTRFALEQFFRDNPNVYVGADLLLYYEEGDPTKSVAPDVLVALGVPKGHRRNYLIWKEGKPPDVVFEFASEGTWQADLGWKYGLYQGLGVKEYFLFDPLAQYFDPPLQGYRLQGRVYVPIPPLSSERGVMGLFSEVLTLELWMRPDGGEGMPYVLRLYDPASGTWLLSSMEAVDAYREAEARAARAEARLAELEAELKRLRDQLAQDEP